MTSSVISGILSGLSVIILAAIGRSVIRLDRSFRRFMAEHLWLLATSLWTRDKVILIMERLNMPIDHPPPNNLEN